MFNRPLSPVTISILTHLCLSPSFLRPYLFSILRPSLHVSSRPSIHPSAVLFSILLSVLPPSFPTPLFRSFPVFSLSFSPFFLRPFPHLYSVLLPSFLYPSLCPFLRLCLLFTALSLVGLLFYNWLIIKYSLRS